MAALEGETVPLAAGEPEPAAGAARGLGRALLASRPRRVATVTCSVALLATLAFVLWPGHKGAKQGSASPTGAVELVGGTPWLPWVPPPVGGEPPIPQPSQEEYTPPVVPASVNKGLKKPHIVFFLADDYGWGNIGVHRRPAFTPAERQAQAETQTPELDRLIREGVLLERHYAYKICSPSRSSLQSGRLAVHVNTVNTGVTYWNPADNTSGFAGIPRNMTGLAQKMKEGGYMTHMVGKWDAGMATPEQTPWGMGYDSWLGYFQHANDYWQEGLPFASTGELDVCLNKFRDFSLYNRTYRGGVDRKVAAELGCPVSVLHTQTIGLEPQVNATGCKEIINGDDICLPEACYEEAMFNAYAMKIIKEHNRRRPLFLFYAFHLLHTPLQIPKCYLDKIDWMVKRAGGKPFDSQNRRLYAAMVLYMDTMVSKVVWALKERRMYDDTLIIFCADNGGPVYEPGSANNHPLLGGKYSDWEGGVRTNAFVSGGYVPFWRRGQRFHGIISIADWYATLARIAGVCSYDKAAEEANRYLLENGLPPLPPVDGRPQWENIIYNNNGRKDPLHLSANALLHWPYKLVTGPQEYSFWQGKVFPNCSTFAEIGQTGPLFSDMDAFGVRIPLSTDPQTQDNLTYTYDCGPGGCLFNVAADPTEHKDLSGDRRYGDILFAMQSKLYNLNLANFNPYRGEPALQACNQSADLGGFYGPFVDVDDFYKGVELTPAQEAVAELNKAELTVVNETLTSRDEELIRELFEKYGIVDLARYFNGSSTLDVCFNKSSC